MKIYKKVQLNNNSYYIEVNVKYKRVEYGFPVLCLDNYKDDYWDGGDCSRLIEKIEKSYTYEKAISYDKHILFMADVIYLYERMPFISGVKDISSDISYISREEIEGYIKEFKIDIKKNDKFKLFDKGTWSI